METPNNKNVPWRWLVAAIGLVFGLMDAGLFRLLDTQVTVSTHEATWMVLSYYALSFAFGGYLIGRLRESNIQVRRDADTITAQLEALRASEARARHFEELARIGRMAATVAHEVRNPLAVINSSAGVIKERCLDDHRVQRAAGFIEDESTRLADFVRALLDYSRPLTPEPAACSLKEIVADACRVQDTLEVVCQDDMTLHVDRGLWLRLMTVLMNNAAEAGASRLTVTAEDHEVFVEDDGRGLTQDKFSELFEPFFTTKAQGTGLGLPLAKKIAVCHGGDIVADGTCASGARFVITLQRATPADPDLHAEWGKSNRAGKDEK